MSPRSHKRFTAWLGILAMWLVVFMPAVSQVVMAAQGMDLTLPICSVALDGSGTHEIVVRHVPADDSQHPSKAGDLGACGYCDLLTNHVALPTVATPQPAAALLVQLAAATPLSTSFTPIGAFPSGRPRGPPLLS